MTAYLYRATLYCECCTSDIIAELTDIDEIDKDDSECYPQGPYPDGGGESDSPAHCDNCNCFLENPLTTDGREYVLDIIREHITNKRGTTEVLEEWIDYYDITLTELLQ